VPGKYKGKLEGTFILFLSQGEDELHLLPFFCLCNLLKSVSSGNHFFVPFGSLHLRFAGGTMAELVNRTHVAGPSKN
jgi:hypothetical protein